MASPTNTWKVGLFVIAASVLAVGALFWLGARRFNRELLGAVTYFEESVQGLNEGAAVEMRGVKIGRVSEITIAPDQRLVEVRAQLERDVLERLGFVAPEEDWRKRTRVGPKEMRVQLATTGITGVKFMLVDFFDPERHPPRELSFTPPLPYIPSTSSTLKNLEFGMNAVLERLPVILDRVESFVASLEEGMGEVELGELATSLQVFLANMAALDLSWASEDAASLVAELRATNARAGEVLVRIDGLAEDVSRASGSWNELARSASALLSPLQQDLRALREALRALRDLASYLERDPGSILRGREGRGDL